MSLRGRSVFGRYQSYVFLCMAVTYGFVLSRLPDVQFRDFSNYLIYADSSSLIILRNAQVGVLSILSNEPLWLILNAGLGLFLDPEKVVRTFIFIGASSVAWLVLRHYPKHFVWLILFLLLPSIIKNFLIHLRQGFAISVFLWGWFSTSRFRRWLLFGLTPFIHASFFIILALIALNWTLRFMRTASDAKIIAFGSAGVAVSLSLGAIAEIMGARQATEYTFDGGDGSGLAFLLWAMLLGAMLSAKKPWLREHTFEIGLVAFYLITYWHTEVAARIFESGLILVLVSVLTLHGWSKRMFLAVALGAGALDWALRVGQPALGFGSV